MTEEGGSVEKVPAARMTGSGRDSFNRFHGLSFFSPCNWAGPRSHGWASLPHEPEPPSVRELARRVRRTGGVGLASVSASRRGRPAAVRRVDH